MMPATLPATPAAAPAAPFIPVTGLTPGSYLRECRKRAGKTLDQCAAAIAVRTNDRALAKHDLQRLERDRPGDYGRLVHCLKRHGAFPFDMGTFIALAAETADPASDVEFGQ